MSLFWTDSIALCCRNITAARKFWSEVFDCKPVRVPPNWGDPLPSDVALTLPGDDDPTILLIDQMEVERAGLERPNGRPIIFCNKLKKAHEHLTAKGAAPGPIQDGGGTQFFEIVDPEGTVIEICKEP
jgi:catechol 2,3-dioxygenase-like lactoylglutathione lyase family enzyme